MNLDCNLNHQENVLLIFGGFASHPSHFIPFIPKNYDSIILYHYQHLNFNALNLVLNRLNKESKITLLGFSMGVFIARIFLESQDSISFVRKIAINGTEYGIHSRFGIPPKLFKLTQKTFDLETFKLNLFGEFLAQTQNFLFLDSQILREELGFFIKTCAQFPNLKSEIVWNQIVISKKDLIFNTQFQRNFWIDFKNSKKIGRAHV